jgi:hypothetical protein
MKTNPDEKISGKNLYLKILGCIALISIAGFFIWIIFTNYNSAKGKFELRMGSNSVTIDIDQKKIGLSDFLDIMDKNEQVRIDFLSILKERYELFSFEDPRLSENIEKIDYDHSIAKKIRYFLDQKVGPFSKNYEKYYNIESADFLIKLEKLELNCEISKKIRECFKLNKGPFKSDEQKVILAINKTIGLKENFAAVCDSTIFLGENVQLRDESRKYAHTVIAAKIYCADIDTKMSMPIIWIHEKTAKRLSLKNADISNGINGYANIYRGPVKEEFFLASQ